MWRSALERVVGAVDRGPGQTIWADLSIYSGVLLLYAAGIGSLAGERYDDLRAILLDPRFHYHNEWRVKPAGLLAFRVRSRPSPTGSPLPDRLASDVRPLVAHLVPDDAAFDRLEYLLGLIYLGLIYLDLTRTEYQAWGPVGRLGAAAARCGGVRRGAARRPAVRLGGRRDGAAPAARLIVAKRA